MIPLLAALLPGANPAPPPPRGPSRTSTWVEFPGKGPAWMDSLAFDPARHLPWLPAGSRGQVFVLDTAANAFRTVQGFPTRTTGAGDRGAAYVPDARGGRLMVVAPNQ